MRENRWAVLDWNVGGARFDGNLLNPTPSPPKCWNRQFVRIIMYVYRETAKIKRMISLLNFLTAPAVMSNTFWRRMVKT